MSSKLDGWWIRKLTLKVAVRLSTKEDVIGVLIDADNAIDRNWEKASGLVEAMIEGLRRYPEWSAMTANEVAREIVLTLDERRYARGTDAEQDRQA